jgi:hypothetical protein
VICDIACRRWTATRWPGPCAPTHARRRHVIALTATRARRHGQVQGGGLRRPLRQASSLESLLEMLSVPRPAAPAR